MPFEYGLRISNNLGQTQIDSKYKNLCYLSAYSTIPSVMKSVFVWDVSLGIPYGDPIPLVAFKTDSTDCYFTLASLYRSGDNWEGFIMQKYNTSVFLRYPTVYVNLFTGTPQIAEPDYGLIVSNDSGVTVFHSDENYLKVVGVYSGSLAFSDSPNFDDITVVSAENYFICIPARPVYVWTSGPSTFVRNKGILKVNSTTIRYGMYDLPLADAGVVYGTAGWEDNYKIIEVTHI